AGRDADRASRVTAGAGTLRAERSDAAAARAELIEAENEKALREEGLWGSNVAAGARLPGAASVSSEPTVLAALARQAYLAPALRAAAGPYQRGRCRKPPPPPPFSRGRASFTLRVRPPICEPSSAWMAASASSEAISTKPKPRGRPVSRSLTRLTLLTSPCDAKSSRSSSSVAE